MYKAFSGQPKVARADTSHHFLKNLGRVAELVYISERIKKYLGG